MDPISSKSQRYILDQFGPHLLPKGIIYTPKWLFVAFRALPLDGMLGDEGKRLPGDHTILNDSPRLLPAY
jgi:hypothetical protein